MSTTRDTAIENLVKKINSNMTNFNQQTSLQQYNEHQQGVAALALDAKNNNLKEKDYFIGRYDLSKDQELQAKIVEIKKRVSTLKGTELMDVARIHIAVHGSPDETRKALEGIAVEAEIAGRIREKLGMPDTVSILIEASKDPKFVKVKIPGSAIKIYLAPEEKSELTTQTQVHHSATQKPTVPEWEIPEKINSERQWFSAQIDLLEKKAIELNADIQKYDPSGDMERMKKISELVNNAKSNLGSLPPKDLFLFKGREGITAELKNYVTATLVDVLQSKQNEAASKSKMNPT